MTQYLLTDKTLDQLKKFDPFNYKILAAYAWWNFNEANNDYFKFSVNIEESENGYSSTFSKEFRLCKRDNTICVEDVDKKAPLFNAFVPVKEPLTNKLKNIFGFDILFPIFMFIMGLTAGSLI